jgi:hypothetical protein
MMCPATWFTPARAAEATPAASPATIGNHGLQPAPAGTPVSSRGAELAAVGYVEEEKWLKGQAATYAKHGEWGKDGKWTPEVRDAAKPYETRMLIRRPQNAARFNGTVIVEWLNTSLGIDLDGVWIVTRDELIREGYAWVGVSAEDTSVEAMRQANPQRYANVSIDTEDRSYDIFTDAARAIRAAAPQWGAPASGAKPVRLLATGYSQSGSFIYTYINTFHPRTKAFDGYYVRGAAWAAIPLNEWDINTYCFRIRQDLDVPVMILQTEMEIQICIDASKTVDTDKLRYWEVAGSTHLDRHMQEGARSLVGLKDKLDMPRCLRPTNTLPTWRFDNAALHGLREWVATGKAPAKAPRMQRSDWGFVQNDATGHAIGGLRLPEMDAPLVRYGIFGNFATRSLALWEGFSCMAGGSSIPLDAKALSARYPDDDAYRRAYTQAADKLLKDGHILPADHAEMIKQVATARVPR